MLSRLKWLLLLLPFAALLSTGVRTMMPGRNEDQLVGVDEVTPPPPASPSAFWRGEFQTQSERYFESELAFRPSLVRTENTMNLAVFHEISGHTQIPIVLGKQQTLFEKNYIDNLNGVADEKGAPPAPAPGTVAETAQRVGQAARAFQSLGIKFLFIFYPGKATLLADRVPPRFRLPGGREKSEAGYQALLKQLKLESVPVIDGVEAVRELQRQQPNLVVFSKSGTHWTDAAACTVASRIVASLAAVAADASTGPRLDCLLGPSAPATGIDTDLARLSNVWDMSRFIEPLPAVTPVLTQPLSEGPTHTLIIGTSFSSHLVRLLKTAGVFQSVRYMEYYRSGQTRLKLNRELRGTRLVIVEQWQASRLTVNVTDFLNDLERQSGLFRHALRGVSAH